MMRVWQVVAFSALAAAFLHAQESAGTFPWTPIKVEGKAFSRELDMLDSEREEYATSFANFSANRVAAAKASQASLNEARRMISLALHLSPRNKRATILNFQLGQGTLPEPVAVDFSPETLSRLISTRAVILGKQAGEENALVSRMFMQLAAQLDPRNEDAVYASEVQRLDHGPVDWSVLIHSDAPTQTPP
jgi:hypothetical protein